MDYSGMMTNSKINSLTKKTLFGITSPAEGKTGEKLVYTVSVTTELGDSKELANVAQLQAVLRGPCDVELPCMVTNPRLGQYDLSCTPLTAGPYELVVTLNSVRLFEDRVVKTEVVGTVSVVQGLSFAVEGLQNGHAQEDQPIELKVKSQSEGPCDIDLNNLQLSIVNASNEPLAIPVRRRAKGHYAGSFKVELSGVYRLTARYFTNDRWNEVISRAVEFSNATFSGYLAPPMPKPTARLNEPVAFKLQSTDANERRVACGGDDWLLAVGGPKAPELSQVTDRGDGTYQCELTFGQAGNYTIKVLLRGEVEARGSPLKIEVL